MKKVVLVLLLIAVPLLAKDRAWQTGKLVKVEIEAVKGDSVVNVTTTNYGAIASLRSADEINYYAYVEDERYTYFAGRKLYGGRLPLLTENAPISFAVEKDILILKDDRGKEFKMRLAKRTAKN
jgi:hypothetical protein